VKACAKAEAVGARDDASFWWFRLPVVEPADLGVSSSVLRGSATIRGELAVQGAFDGAVFTFSTTLTGV